MRSCEGQTVWMSVWGQCSQHASLRRPVEFPSMHLSIHVSHTAWLLYTTLRERQFNSSWPFFFFFFFYLLTFFIDRRTRRENSNAGKRKLMKMSARLKAYASVSRVFTIYWKGNTAKLFILPSAFDDIKWACRVSSALWGHAKLGGKREICAAEDDFPYARSFLKSAATNGAMRCYVRAGMRWGQVDARSGGWVSDPPWPIDEDPSSLDPLGTGGVDTRIVEVDFSRVPVLQQIFLDLQYLEHGFIILCTMRPDVAAGDGQNMVLL